MTSFPSVYIVSAVRTPIGGFQQWVPYRGGGTHLTGRLQITFELERYTAWLARHKRLDIRPVTVSYELRLTFLPLAALERVPGVDPKDVEEVFFGNVISAKSVHDAVSSVATSNNRRKVWAKTRLDSALLVLDSKIQQFARLSTKYAPRL